MSEQRLLDQRVVIDGADFTYSSVDIPMEWSDGSIKRPEISDESYGVLVGTIPDAIVRVDESNLDKSGCTDGRTRLHNLDGSTPVDTQKTVGADVMEMFVAAEALGASFYGNELNEAPVADRMSHVLKHMVANRIIPTTHEACGARGGLVTVLENGVNYASDMSVVEPISRRLSIFSEENVSVEEVQQVASAWNSRDLSGYNEEEVRQLILDVSGEAGIEVLATDNTPNHGHREALVLRMNIPGYTFSTRKYEQILRENHPELSGFEVFAVNDDRINDRLAPKMADNDAQRKVASVAMHYFGDVGHATLSKNLPTVRLDKTA